MQISGKAIVAFVLIFLLLMLVIEMAVFGSPQNEAEDGVCPMCGRTHDGGPIDRMIGAWHRFFVRPVAAAGAGDRS